MSHRSLGFSRAARLLAIVVLGVLLTGAVTSPAQAEGAIVIHPVDFPDCEFFPGDIPGIDIFFPANCTIIYTASGDLHLIAVATLPAGFTLDHTLRGTLPCSFDTFEGTGSFVATPSGRVSAVCHLDG